MGLNFFMFSFLAELLLLFVRGLYMNTVKEKKNSKPVFNYCTFTEEKENKKNGPRNLIERYDVTAEIFVILSKMATKS